MKRTVPILASLSMLMAYPTYAVSESECAIWLCLPNGFSVSECAPAHSAFKKRIRKDEPPLPSLSSCMVGPEGAKSDGRYEMGYEEWEPCKAGYEQIDFIDPFESQRMKACVSETCSDKQPDVYGKFACEHYLSVKRSKPNFIKIWVDNQYQGQYFY